VYFNVVYFWFENSEQLRSHADVVLSTRYCCFNAGHC